MRNISICRFHTNSPHDQRHRAVFISLRWQWTLLAARFQRFHYCDHIFNCTFICVHSTIGVSKLLKFNRVSSVNNCNERKNDNRMTNASFHTNKRCLHNSKVKVDVISSSPLINIADPQQTTRTADPIAIYQCPFKDWKYPIWQIKNIQ